MTSLSSQGSLWQAIWHRPALLIDVAMLVLICTVHVISLRGAATEAADKAKLADSIRGGAAGGLTIVGVLIPLSILAVQLRATGQSVGAARVPKNALVDFFVGDSWLVVSLAAGLYVLFVAAIRGTYEDLGRRKDVLILFGFQLIFLLVGVIRLLWALAGLVGSLLPVG